MESVSLGSIFIGDRQENDNDKTNCSTTFGLCCKTIFCIGMLHNRFLIHISFDITEFGNPSYFAVVPKHLTFVCKTYPEGMKNTYLQIDSICAGEYAADTSNLVPNGWRNIEGLEITIGVPANCLVWSSLSKNIFKVVIKLWYSIVFRASYCSISVHLYTSSFS